MASSPFEHITTTEDSERIAVQLALPGETPLFDGHFPGQPILPGVGLLAMVEAAHAGSHGAAPAYGYRRIKFRSLVTSAGRFTVSFTKTEEVGKTPFTVVHKQSEVATGFLVNDPCELPAPPEKEISGTTHPFPELTALIPHRRPMRVAEQLRHVETDHSITTARVRQTWPLTDSQGGYGVMLVELIAQTASALIGWEGRNEDSEAGKGYLVGIREARVLQPRIPFGTNLETQVRTIRKRENYAVFNGTVTAGEKQLCKAAIQAFKPPSPEQENARLTRQTDWHVESFPG